MKYIMFRCTDHSGEMMDLPIIFPKMMVHRHVAGQLASVLRNQHGFEKVELVGAGETNIHCFSCSGSSETLNGLESRGKKDRDVIDGHDIHNGLVDHEERKPGKPKPESSPRPWSEIVKKKVVPSKSLK